MMEYKTGVKDPFASYGTESTLKPALHEAHVAVVLNDVMTLHCPVAVMAAASAKVTWEYTIENS